ncbi:MAG: GNAT family N-acetyltransferase [Gemmatimonadales bacterium]
MATALSGEATTIGIRDAADADLPSVVEILNREIAGSVYLYMETPITLGERLKWLGAHRKAGLPVLIGTVAGNVAGWASLSRYRPSSGYRHTAEVSVYIDPRAQRRGIARRLVAALHDWAAHNEIRAIVASIDSENGASMGLFESLGYVEVARLPNVGCKFGQWRTQLLLQRAV